MNRDDICAIGVTFVEDKNYTLSRYCTTEQDLFF